ncbi:3-hydroxyacyl-ACP dehydratase FabZ family protein [Pareuzebyella sediminis]|uniref:3-hydroxyacyl-ACP dehydratase FabZ family protein n=1 Tax=Pareuzebyella sediminis TaxID=2607998 RepID=UPI0011EC7538|nr:FabA/FabZ family ACP-dehydratase [Pareuzebyella sediminis]
MNYKDIITQLPYDQPFLFVDELLEVTDDGAKGCYTFSPEASFYQGHFKGHPVTPGVLLTECCAQIGLVCLGLHLLQQEKSLRDAHPKIALSSTDMEFLLPVFPPEKVIVSSKKVYYRFHKLKCTVQMHNEQQQLVCKGTIAGMLKADDHG